MRLSGGRTMSKGRRGCGILSENVVRTPPSPGRGHELITRRKGHMGAPPSLHESLTVLGSRNPDFLGSKSPGAYMSFIQADRLSDDDYMYDDDASVYGEVRALFFQSMFEDEISLMDRTLPLDPTPWCYLSHDISLRLLSFHSSSVSQNALAASHVGPSSCILPPQLHLCFRLPQHLRLRLLLLRPLLLHPHLRL